MSLYDSTLVVLDIKDQNLHVAEVRHETRGDYAHRHQVEIIRADLSYHLSRCPLCGFEALRRNGHKLTHIKLKSVSDEPLVLELNKQRWLCQNCGKTTMATTPLVCRQHGIATSMAIYILKLAYLNLPVSTIAQITGISASSVQRILNEKLRFRQPHELPANLCFDEFRSTHSLMSFICLDADTHHLVTILGDRYTKTIKDYFLTHFSLKQRQKARHVMMDMNASYQTFIHALFPNAEVVIDRFHIVQLMTQAIDQVRLSALKTLDKQSRLYKIMKTNWRLFHKIHLDAAKARMIPGIWEEMTEQNAVDLGLDVFPAPKAAYETYIVIYDALMNHHPDQLAALINQYEKQDTAMDVAMATLKKNLRGVSAASTSPYSNGPLEGVNRKIKALKRSCYGFRNQHNFFIRIYQIIA